MTSNLIKDAFSSKSCIKIIPQTTKISFKPPEELESKSSIKCEGPKTKKKREKTLNTKKQKKKEVQPLIKSESPSNTEDVLSKLKLGKGIKISFDGSTEKKNLRKFVCSKCKADFETKLDLKSLHCALVDCSG